jgi:hypothetical protein
MVRACLGCDGRACIFSAAGGKAQPKSGNARCGFCDSDLLLVGCASKGGRAQLKQRLSNMPAASRAVAMALLPAEALEHFADFAENPGAAQSVEAAAAEPVETAAAVEAAPAAVPAGGNNVERAALSRGESQSRKRLAPPTRTLRLQPSMHEGVELPQVSRAGAAAGAGQDARRRVVRKPGPQSAQQVCGSGDKPEFLGQSLSQAQVEAMCFLYNMSTSRGVPGVPYILQDALPSHFAEACSRAPWSAGRSHARPRQTGAKASSRSCRPQAPCGRQGQSRRRR